MIDYRTSSRNQTRTDSHLFARGESSDRRVVRNNQVVFLLERTFSRELFDHCHDIQYLHKLFIFEKKNPDQFQNI